MASAQKVGIVDAVSPWPIARTLVQYVPVGDLINLARSSSSLRAALHNFDSSVSTADDVAGSAVRSSLHIGAHQTSYWEGLKAKAPFLCASPRHTKGDTIHPCRYCSRPICEACIVRASFAKPNENTFKNRCRYLCKDCWSSGNKHKKQKFPARPSPPADGDDVSHDFCACTNKKDGWVCLECKDAQNAEALGSGATSCFGHGCAVVLEGDKERRRICLWCNKPLRTRVTGESRLAWNQKFVDAHRRAEASRQADYEEYVRQRQKSLKASRRELRGDEAVRGDPEADKPQFVRHLDTVNYERVMSRSQVPSGDAVYASKTGTWTYSSAFLSAFSRKCGRVMPNADLAELTGQGEWRFARTNMQKREQVRAWQKEAKRAVDAPAMRDLSRLWLELKARLLQARLGDQLSWAAIRDLMLEEFHFSASEEEYAAVIEQWESEIGGKQKDVSVTSASASIDHSVNDAAFAKKVQEELDRDAAAMLQEQWELEDVESDINSGREGLKPALEQAESNEAGSVSMNTDEDHDHHQRKRKARPGSEDSARSRQSSSDDTMITPSHVSKQKRLSMREAGPSDKDPPSGATSTSPKD